MSDTPRTDAEVEAFSAPTGGSLVYSSFARDLERELIAARAEVARLKSIDVRLIPNEWTLDHFKSICDIKMPEAAMISGEQLLALLQDAARLDWLSKRSEAGFRSRGSNYIISRKSIDTAMENKKNEQ